MLKVLIEPYDRQSARNRFRKEKKHADQDRREKEKGVGVEGRNTERGGG